MNDSAACPLRRVGQAAEYHEEIGLKASRLGGIELCGFAGPGSFLGLSILLDLLDFSFFFNE